MRTARSACCSRAFRYNRSKVCAASMATNQRLDVGKLEGRLWDAACLVRGPVDAPKYKDYVLPLMFLKRLSDVFDG